MLMKSCITKPLWAAAFAFGLAFAGAWQSSPAQSEVLIEELAENTLLGLGSENNHLFTSWGNMPVDEMMLMLKDLSQNKQSAVLSRWTAEVLKQRTSVGQSGWSQQKSAEWLDARAQTLLDLGDYRGAIALIEQLPEAQQTPKLTAVYVDALLLADQLSKACKVAHRSQGKSLYLQKTDMVCLAVLHKEKQARLAFELWQEKNQDKLFSYIMESLLDEAPKKPKKAPQSLTVLEAFALNYLQSSLIKDVTLPAAYQILMQNKTTDFKTAVNVKKLIEMWQKKGLTPEQIDYKLYLLDTYANLYRPELRLIRKNDLFKSKDTMQVYNPRSLWLKEKPADQLTGFDLILSIWLLHHRVMSADKAFLTLGKAGFDLSEFVLEEIAP